jgi:hypothetical protein
MVCHDAESFPRKREPKDIHTTPQLALVSQQVFLQFQQQVQLLEFLQQPVLLLPLVQIPLLVHVQVLALV